jgi:predicted dehydrogenase
MVERSMLRIGLIGFGYWGASLARNFQTAPASILASISDRNPERMVEAAALYPASTTTSSANDLIGDGALDAIAIATPPATHFPLAMAALKAGKHVWIEKPIACSSMEAAALVEEARARNRVLMVDHTFVYSPAVRKIRELIQGGELGSLYYYDSVRTNLGRFQNDASVLWDLAYHDLAILDYLLDQQPVHVSSHGAAHLGDRHEVSYLTLEYPSGFHAHVHVSWLTPVKVRRVMLAGSKRMLLWNDLESVRKLEIYEHAVSPGHHAAASGCNDVEAQRRIGYRAGELHVPWLEVSEPLQNAARHFIDCIQTGARPLTDGESGLRVTKILEQAQQMAGAGQ